MRRVFKYRICKSDGIGIVFDIKVPFSAIALFAAVQYDYICVWADVDDNDFLIDCKVLVISTGQEIPDGFNYVDTLTFRENTLIFHVYTTMVTK